jgi:Ca2+-binding RTX toxin-like protein
VECDDVNTTVACCTYNEGAGEDVNTIHALGTQHDDEIYFNYGPVFIVEALKPTANHDMDGVMDGEEGNDTLSGSPWDQNDYREFIHGDYGDDTIEGNAGGDRIWGGPDDDIIHGHEGPDRLLGGPGDDWLFGEEDDDTLCDANGNYQRLTLQCATDDGHVLDAGEGDDYIWFDKFHVNCTGTMDPSFSTASTSGAQAADSDTCADDFDWTGSITVDWPDYCDIPTPNAPTNCSTAWPY